MMKTQMTDSQRRQMRTYVSAIGVGKAPELLGILARIVDGEDDFELVQVYILASIFDDRAPQQTTEFLTECGIGVADIVQALKTVYDRVQNLHAVHSWN
jgi:hypothetical protein